MHSRPLWHRDALQRNQVSLIPKVIVNQQTLMLLEIASPLLITSVCLHRHLYLLTIIRLHMAAKRPKNYHHRKDTQPHHSSTRLKLALQIMWLPQVLQMCHRAEKYRARHRNRHPRSRHASWQRSTGSRCSHTRRCLIAFPCLLRLYYCRQLSGLGLSSPRLRAGSQRGRQISGNTKLMLISRN